ncbi:hypothetical protein [Streptomyces sp. NPDC059063]|uniref:hypothetical protein n=1 Tax=unclassified Streptomyces TaxID=2593676 RepID=UPI0036809CF5
MAANAEFRPRTQLDRDQAWTSGDGHLVLRLQRDGNFVLELDGKAQWQAPGAWGRGYEVAFEKDGNLYVYDDRDQLVWHALPLERRNFGGKLRLNEETGKVEILDQGQEVIWSAP